MHSTAAIDEQTYRRRVNTLCQSVNALANIHSAKITSPRFMTEPEPRRGTRSQCLLPTHRETDVSPMTLQAAKAERIVV